jgi:pyruvate formate lyase activating enzyme
MLKVHSIETFGTHEGPGIRLVIFLQGCNFNCAYCHNPDTISGGGKAMTISEIIDLLEDQKPYFGSDGGLTVSGGEPGLQAKELIELFKEARKRGFNTALDTNASLNSEDYRVLLGLTDLALIDLKHFDDNLHLKLTGQSNKNVLESIAYRNSLAKPFWIRYVLVPGWTDQSEHLEALGQYLQQFKYLERLEILPYHNLGAHKYKELKIAYRLEDVVPPSAEQINKAKDILSKYLKNIIIRH